MGDQSSEENEGIMTTTSQSWKRSTNEKQKGMIHDLLFFDCQKGEEEVERSIFFGAF